MDKNAALQMIEKIVDEYKNLYFAETGLKHVSMESRGYKDGFFLVVVQCNGIESFVWLTIEDCKEENAMRELFDKRFQHCVEDIKHFFWAHPRPVAQEVEHASV